MGKRMVVILLFSMALVVLMSCVVDVKAEATKTLSEVNRKLKLLNKPAVKSIKTEDGEIIDCVDIYKQPAFDHPALRNHTIQIRPSFTIQDDTSSTKGDSSPAPALSQTWQKSGSCPLGTVPIRRIRKQDLLRAASLEHFGRDGPRTSWAVNAEATNGQSRHFVHLNGSKIPIFPMPEHSTAFLVTKGYNYVGARGGINAWSPRVESADEYTTGQIWIKNGPPGINFESVEAGWMVNPKLFGGAEPRLFARWTLDGYEKTGCINLVCPGFVQTSKTIVLGGILQPLSQKNGPQYQINLMMDRDPSTGNWWLHSGNDIIGYWPGPILSYLKNSATTIEWGGDVYSKKVKGNSPHTATAMGSGDFAAGRMGSAAYVGQYMIVDGYLRLKNPEWVDVFAEEPDCYTAVNYLATPKSEAVFYYGGPGRNPQCP
ncbi:uncharacterized protein LOC122295408 [Carya illinoinensis]|nr:uncharacterized protein LOC122295408 [Carya illinoinensis]